VLDQATDVRGRDAVIAGWADFFAAWDDYRMDAEEYIEVGPDQVVVPVLFTARGHGSNVPIEFRYAQLFTLRDGKVLSVENWSSRENALAAAWRMADLP
jgi:ketosteroid isomerase-like protein